MGEDLVTKLHVKKLIANGSNWVTYCNCMMWALRSCGLLEHLTSVTITVTYTNAETVNNVTLEARWNNDKAITMHVITSLIPNTVFTNIKSKNTGKDVWDTLKALFEGQTQMVIMGTSQQLQQTKCSEENNVREHFDKLISL